jgi:hypothetical protein
VSRRVYLDLVCDLAGSGSRKVPHATKNQKSKKHRTQSSKAPRAHALFVFFGYVFFGGARPEKLNPQTKQIKTSAE